MDLLSKSIKELAGEFLNKLEDDNYSKDYVGTVEDNKDPEKIGRCRIRVHGLYDDIPVEDLPWATPAFSIPFGVKGCFIVPEVGTTISVEFDDGDLYEPKYTAKVLDERNLNFEADKDEDYPDSVIFYESKEGDYLKVNRFKGEFTIKTGAGVLLKFSENGDINLTNLNSENGDCKIRLKGNYTLDNRLGDYNLITSKISTSAFSDIDTKSNGGINSECLDDYNVYTNRDINLFSSDRLSVKARSEIRSETIISKTLANKIEFLPSTSATESINADGQKEIIPSDFSFGVGNDTTKLQLMTVEASVFGGPFNCIPFDPLTGQPHQGRLVTGKINSLGFVADVEKVAEIAKMKATIIAKYAKMTSDAMLKITKKYASIDSSAKMVMETITGSTVLIEEKALEIKNTTQALNDSMAAELAMVDSVYSKYLTEPIYGNKTSLTSVGKGPEKERQDYEFDLDIAKPFADEDVTGKTTAKDLVGSGKGIINDDNT